MDNQNAVPDPITGEIDGTVTIKPLSVASGLEYVYVKIFSVESFCKLVTIPVRITSE